MLIRTVLLNLLAIYSGVLIARVVLSFIPLIKPGWSPPGLLAPVVDVIYGLTEPPLQFLRRVIPQPMGFPFDLSFIVLFLIVNVLQRIVRASGGG